MAAVEKVDWRMPSLPGFNNEPQCAHQQDLSAWADGTSLPSEERLVHVGAETDFLTVAIKSLKSQKLQFDK